MISWSSVSDLENDPAPLPGAAGPNDRTQRACESSLAADHFADVVFCDVEAQDDGVLSLFLLDPDGVWIVDQLARQVRDQISQCS